MAYQTIVRFCPAAGALTTKLQLRRETQGQDTLRRCFAAESDASFAGELQRRIAAAEASLKPPSGSVFPSQVIPRRHQSRWHRHHVNRGQITKLVAAAAAGAFVLNLVRQPTNSAFSVVPSQAALYPSAVLQQQVQEDFACPPLHPGSLKICIQWLEDRRRLLEAEQTALRLLPPTDNRPLREKEIFSDLQSTEVMMSAVLTSLEQAEANPSEVC